MIKKLLRENLQQADKIFFNSGKLSPEEREFVLSITKGDSFTRIMADWLYHLTKIWSETLTSVTTITFMGDFYSYLKTYDKNVLPVVHDINNYTALTNERGVHVLDLFSCLKNRSRAILNLNKLPSTAKRNLQNVIRKPESNEHGFQILGDKFRDLNNSLTNLPKDDAKRQMLMGKIFTSKNSLDQMIDMANHYSFAFNSRGEETSKDDLIANLEYINADLIQNSENILVVKVNDYESMQDIGCTSAWCFSQPDSDNYWNDYASLGYVFVIFDFSKDFDDATFMMTYLPVTSEVYASTNVSLDALDIDDEFDYLSSIGVDTSLLNSLHKNNKPKAKEPLKNSNQMSLFETVIVKKLLRDKFKEKQYI